MDHSCDKQITIQKNIEQIYNMPCCTDCYTGYRDLGPIVCYRISCRGHYLNRESKPHDLIKSPHSNASNIKNGFCSKPGCLGHSL